ncbi:FIMAH domain-containing protein [Paenibacillus contaminans]|uniref:F5/8 type C domain-containing protein n=1 Tax=Paenibacillus contaminans TaxID=450362 RepID=A0A329MM58_9BACL|nr:exo-alpha-sialidase [Paenibacillus contaminans]RAV20925.1 hypothetical protein DQG23_12600 [Paenibacillus contaminans]
MRNKWAVKLVLFFSITAFMLAGAPVYGEVRHTSIPDVVITQPSGNFEGYFPDITKAANGDLLVVHYWATQHVGDNGSIVMKRSTDGGLTWSSAQTIVDTSYDDRDASIMKLADGTLLLSWFTYTPGIGAVDVRVKRSSDNGATWTNEVIVGTGLAWSAVSAKIIELSNGDLLIPLYGRVAGVPRDRATVVRSTDKGLTWPSSSEVTLAASGTIGMNEEGIAELENGHIKALVRSAGGDLSGYEVHSFDYGASWGAPQKLDAKIHAPELFRIPGTDKVFQAWSEVGSPYGRAVTVRMGYLNAPWSSGHSEFLYTHTGAGDMGYSGTVLLSATDLLTVYYDASKRIIGGTFSNIVDWEKDFGPKLDLKAMYNAGSLTVATDMTWTSPTYPDVGVASVFDGSTDYWHSAFKNTEAPASYIIDLKSDYSVSKLGVALKPGYTESADIYFSNDGINWGSPAQSYSNANTTEVDYKLFGQNMPVRYIKVQVTASSGWAGLNEIELYGHRVPDAPLMSAQPLSPTNGSVTLSIAYPEHADQRKYSIDNGPLTDYSGPIIMTSNGKVEAYSISDAGISSAAATFTISNIDRLAPEVSLLSNGTEMGDSAAFLENDVLAITVAASDAQSGIESVAITWDGAPYEQGTQLDLRGKPGAHTVSAAVYDAAGNRTERTAIVLVQTDVNTMKALLAAYAASGELQNPLGTQLQNSLDQVVHHLSKGRLAQAAHHMDNFLKHIRNGPRQDEISESAQAALIADAQYLIQGWTP